MRLAVPLFVHPAVDPGSWQVIEERADEFEWVVVNAADGPGSLLDGVLAAGVARIREAGASVLGYVDGAYGRRPVSELLADHARWRSWYGVSAVFVDRVPSDRLRWVQDVVDQLRGSGAAKVVGNPGNALGADSAVLFDAVVVFEGPIESHRSLDRPAQASSGQQPSSAHLIYDVPRALVNETVHRAFFTGASAIWVTPGVGDNPYHGVPEYLAEVIDAISRVSAASSPEDGSNDTKVVL